MVRLTCNLCQTANVHFVTSKLRRGKGTIYRCHSCEYEFLVKESVRDQKSFYENNYWQSVGPSLAKESSYDEIFESYVPFQNNRLSTISPFLKDQTSVIEIGCSTGHFLFHLKDFVKRGVGVDFDKKALDYCEKKTGYQVISGGLEAAVSELQGETFDVLCCFQVLEHVEDLAAFLNGIKALVKPNGIVYIEVPNLKDPLLTLYDVPDYQKFYYHEDHVHYFSIKSLQKLLRSYGFSGQYLSYQDYNLANHLNWLSTHKPQASCIGGLGAPIIPLQHVDKDVIHSVQNFFFEANKSYLQLLSKLGYTDNLAFVGRIL